MLAKLVAFKMSKMQMNIFMKIVEAPYTKRIMGGTFEKRKDRQTSII